MSERCEGFSRENGLREAVEGRPSAGKRPAPLPCTALRRERRGKRVPALRPSILGRLKNRSQQNGKSPGAGNPDVPPCRRANGARASDGRAPDARPAGIPHRGNGRRTHPSSGERLPTNRAAPLPRRSPDFPTKSRDDGLSPPGQGGFRKGLASRPARNHAGGPHRSRDFPPVLFRIREYNRIFARPLQIPET